MSKITLINDDCFNYLPKIKSESIDLILCDLPYGTTNCSWDSQLDLKKLWKEYERIIKEHGAIVLFAQSPFDKVLACSNLDLYRYEWIWEKTQATGHLNARKMPLKAHENILIFYKKLPKFFPQKTFNHRPIHSYTKYIETQNKTEIYRKANREITGGGETSRYPRDVIIFSSDKQKDHYHPTQKPLALIEYLINSYSEPGDLVLDNCMGSGTTGLACLNLNRQFIGIEINEKYYETSCKRLLKVEE